jgi:predicted ATPase
MERDQLNHLSVEGFTSIKHLDLDLGGVNVVIGPNGSGKSNFLKVFDLLSHIAREKLQLFVQQSGRASSLLYYGPKVTRRIQVELSFDDASYAFRLVATDDDRLVFEWESPTSPFGGERSSTGGHEESNLVTGRETHHDDSLAPVHSILPSWQVYHFADSGSGAPPTQTGDLHDNERLQTNAGNLAAVLYLIQQKHEERYRLIRKTVQRAFPQFEDFALRPDPHNEKKIRLEWREQGSSRRFQPHQLSDGTLRFACLATLFLQPDPPATILVDEPELGLHPRALNVLGGMIRSTAARRQVLLTTQSVTLLNQFAPEDIVVVERKRDTEHASTGEVRSASTFRRLADQDDLDSWLDEYTVGDLWEMNVIGGRP